MPVKVSRGGRRKNPQQPGRRVSKSLAKYVRGQVAPKKAKAKQPGRRVSKSLAQYVRGGQVRNNPDAELSQAAEMFEAFHGKPASKVRTITELERSRGTLADLGRMVALEVWLDEDTIIELAFTGVRLATSPDGGQLYFLGNQKLDLAPLGLDRYMPKDHITIGAVEAIVYQTSKAFHSFEPLEYRHVFGADTDEQGNVIAITGEQPFLQYDVLSEAFYLTGGSYRTRPEGIVN